MNTYTVCVAAGGGEYDIEETDSIGDRSVVATCTAQHDAMLVAELLTQHAQRGLLSHPCVPGRPYDPVLREATTEIRAICTRRNIAAVIMLASEFNAEYAYLIDVPDWSCFNFSENQVLIRTTHLPDQAAKKRAADATISMLCTFNDCFVNAKTAFDAMLVQLRKRFRILHNSRIGKAPDSWPGDGR